MMAKTALELSPEEWKAYRPDSKEREIKIRRRQQAMRLARKAAQLLREEYGAERVLLFGSLAHHGWFTKWSDIDIATVGISPTRFYAAVAAITGISETFHVDLVDLEACSPTLKETISRVGIPL
jgi:predicted nucleotidyltransferase